MRRYVVCKKKQRVRKINDRRALETVGRRLAGQKDSRTRYAMEDNGSAGSRRTRSYVFAGGLLRYFVRNLIISVVNNLVNKPGKTKPRGTLEARLRSSEKREWSMSFTKPESSVALTRVAFRSIVFINN